MATTRSSSCDVVITNKQNQNPVAARAPGLRDRFLQLQTHDAARIAAQLRAKCYNFGMEEALSSACLGAIAFAAAIGQLVRQF
jgi:hypothetical protein